MTSSIRNLGKFGDIFKTTNFAKLNKNGGKYDRPFLCKMRRGIQKMWFRGLNMSAKNASD